MISLICLWQWRLRRAGARRPTEEAHEHVELTLPISPPTISYDDLEYVPELILPTTRLGLVVTLDGLLASYDLQDSQYFQPRVLATEEDLEVQEISTADANHLALRQHNALYLYQEQFLQNERMSWKRVTSFERQSLQSYASHRDHTLLTLVDDYSIFSFVWVERPTQLMSFTLELNACFPFSLVYHNGQLVEISGLAIVPNTGLMMFLMIINELEITCELNELLEPIACTEGCQVRNLELAVEEQTDQTEEDISLGESSAETRSSYLVCYGEGTELFVVQETDGIIEKHEITDSAADENVEDLYVFQSEPDLLSIFWVRGEMAYWASYQRGVPTRAKALLSEQQPDCQIYATHLGVVLQWAGAGGANYQIYNYDGTVSRGGRLPPTMSLL